MKPEASDTVAFKSRNQALKYLECGNLGRAFAHFLVVLQLKPEWKNDLKRDFSSTLCRWGEHLESNQRFKDLFNCYEQAIEIFPENECVLSNLGSHLFRLGHLREAAHYFRQALDINHDYLPAYRNLQSVCNTLVERWHFRMLNDSHRNEAYREAILKKVRQGFISVLDIGTGTGILSLYAVSAGARDIQACDYSPTMCSIAKDVLEANEMSDKVTVINKLSNDLNIPDDLPHRKSLVVTETMDSGLLGEHLLQTLLHAWDQLLKPPCPELLKALDSEAAITEHGVVVPFGAKLWAIPIQSYSIARRNYLLNISESSWSFSNIWLYSDSSEPYDTEDLRGGSMCKFLADPVEVFCFNFNNPEELREYYEGKYDNRSVLFEYEGKADALAVWFDVLLDEDITITSSPFSEHLCCWDQAVFRFREPQDSVLVKASCGGGKLRFDLGQQSSAGRLPTNPNSCLSSDKTRCEFPISSESILFLNNKKLQDNIFVLPELCNKVYNVLDLSPFPVLGLRFAQQKHSNMFCILKTEKEIEAVLEFIKCNSIDPFRVKCLRKNELDEMISNTSDKFDFIFNNLFETSGELKECSINLIPRLLEVLSPGGILAPLCLKMMCQLADCPWITRTTKVVNEELLQKYNIAPFINVYQVSQNLDIDMRYIDCEYLSDPVVCLQITQEELASESCCTENITVSVVKDGYINALPLWYQYQLSTHQEYLSTVARDSHVNQVIYVVEPPCCVKAGDTVVVNVTLFSGIIRLKLTH